MPTEKFDYVVPDCEIPFSFPQSAEDFERQVHECRRELEILCDRLTVRYHGRVIQTALLRAGADNMAFHIRRGHLSCRVARSILRDVWWHTFAQSGWWERAPGRRLACIGACIAIGVVLSMLTGCAARPVQPENAAPLETVNPAADYAEIADWVQDRIANDATFIRHLLWLEDFCKLPRAERMAIAQRRGSEPNCAVLRARH